jgi:hypothetical protein
MVSNRGTLFEALDRRSLLLVLRKDFLIGLAYFEGKTGALTQFLVEILK